MLYLQNPHIVWFCSNVCSLASLYIFHFIISNNILELRVSYSFHFEEYQPWWGKLSPPVPLAVSLWASQIVLLRILTLEGVVSVRLDALVAYFQQCGCGEWGWVVSGFSGLWGRSLCLRIFIITYLWFFFSGVWFSGLPVILWSTWSTWFSCNKSLFY